MLEKINLIFDDFLEKISFKKFWGFRALNIQSFKKNVAFEQALRLSINEWLLILYSDFKDLSKGVL
jgi:hypothetical protein